MTDKKHSGFGTQIVLGTLRTASSLDDEDIFLSDSIADRPELRVQVRYFTIELKPSRCGKNGRGNVHTGSKSRSSVNGQKKVELGISVSPNETTSCDSFHSCRSTTSIQELACKENDIHASSRTQPQKLLSESKKPTIRDEDLLNNLTMVNAIFLSKSSKQHDIRTNENHQRNEKRSCKTDKVCLSRIPSSSTKVCPEVYTCQINHSPRVKYTSKVHGKSIITKPVQNSFDTLYEKMGGDRLSYSKTFSESFEPVSNSKNIDFEVVEQFKNDNRNDLPSGLNDGALPPHFVVQNKICSNSSFATSELLEIKVPEIKFAEIIPFSDESCLPVIRDKNFLNKVLQTDSKIRRTIRGCEESLKLSSPNINSSLLISIDSKDSFLDSTDILNGDGDFSGYAYTENSRRLNKLQLKNMDDIYLRMMIGKSLKLIQNKSESNSRKPESDESDIFESDEECKVLNEYNEDVLKQKSSDSIQPFLRFHNGKLQSCFEDSDQDPCRTVENVDLKNDHSLPLDGEYESDKNHRKLGSELAARASSKLENTQPDNRTCNRGISERTLSVIQEESSDESEDFREDDLADDYCLIDINGRPIHLFDNQGLPLTDHSGRPLRSAQGKLLMNCDQHGIPVVDHGCSIFDMTGRQPHDDHFDPSMAPKMAVSSKLSAGDGRPLLLFDAQGRPLTSVSGTMLVDSSGRGLVQLSSAQEHEP